MSVNFKRTRLFPTAVDHINRAQYQVNMPESYSFCVPRDYLTGELSPIITNTAGSGTMIRSSITINQMVSIVNDDCWFELILDQDVIEVFNHIDMYMMEVKPLVDNGDKTVADYIDRLLVLRKYAANGAYSLCNKYPEYNDSLWGVDSASKDVFATFYGDDTNYMKARLKPPYTVSRTKKEDESQQDSSQVLTRSMNYVTHIAAQEKPKPVDDFSFGSLLEKYK